MRKTIKKPLTDRARMLVVYELQRIKDAGHDPNAALDQSTNHCWADVYPPKDKPIEHKAGSAADKTQEMLKERDMTQEEWVKSHEARRAAMSRLKRAA
jgi:hypothetical protein